jgi:hypothetical protein
MMQSRFATFVAMKSYFLGFFHRVPKQVRQHLSKSEAIRWSEQVRDLKSAPRPVLHTTYVTVLHNHKGKPLPWPCRFLGSAPTICPYQAPYLAEILFHIITCASPNQLSPYQTKFVTRLYNPRLASLRVCARISLALKSRPHSVCQTKFATSLYHRVSLPWSMQARVS